MTQKRPVASLLRQLREERGSSLREVATDMGIAPSHLSRLERGEKGASEHLVRRAAEYYGVNSDALLPDRLPPDVVDILREHPEIFDELRRRYAP